MTAHIFGGYRFGRFELQPDERRLLEAGTPVGLPRHAFDLLTLLVERSGHLVTKDQILERVWPKLVVEENTVQAHMSALRKIVGADAIATVRGQGYRFTIEVTRIDAAPTSLSAPPKHNLPQQLTSFIGRENEIAELRHFLGTTRLLTLTGAGGCGKTRLAMQVAGEKAKASVYPDGIWLVELAPVADPGLVPQTVGNILGLREHSGKSFTQTITEHLASRHLLLVLDNAEHVLGACAQLVDAVLRGCAHLVILVTSQERLGIAGELTYRVPSLSVPDPKQHATPERVMVFESARLFTERARAQRPHFTVTAENAPALALICHRLDGIPLAIELAAPRVRSMSVEEVSRRLDQRFSLLTGGSRVALPRHRTLRSMIDWSYDLLSAAEQAMLNRVSIFSDGWTLDAAEQVCSGAGVDGSEVLDILTSLADKSLVVAEECDGTTRYGLLETVRHYARERLRASGEEAQASRQHLACFLALAEKVEPGLIGPEQQRWLDLLETEHDNVRSALAWSSGPHGDAAGGLRLAGAVSWFWYVRGYLGEGRRWLAGLLAVPTEQSAAARAKALCGAGYLAVHQGDYATARSRCEESLPICRTLGDRAGISRSLNILGIVALERGDYAAARALLEESLAIRRELDNQWGMASTLINLGTVAHSQADHQAATILWEEALQIHRKSGDRFGVSIVLNNLGHQAHQLGDYTAARALLEESLAVCRELSNRAGSGSALHSLGLVVNAQGDHRAALALQEEGLAINRELGDQRRIATSMEAFASIAFAMARHTCAARIWGWVERLREEIALPMRPVAVPGYQREIAAARAALSDDAAFDLAWREGREMTLEEAVQRALDTKHT